MRTIKTIELSATPKFIPPHTRGDRDFDGHGPRVTASARLLIRNTNELWARVSLHAKETKRDWTTASGAAEYRIFSDPTVHRIYSVVSDAYSSASYTDDDHNDDIIQLPGAELVDRFEITGDTRGNEAGTRAGVTVFFNPVKIDCEVGSLPDCVITKTVDPTPMFVPPHTGGDRDFYGHGPEINVSASISVENGREIWARVYMRAIETQRDWTRAEGAHRFRIYQHDRPIDAILSDTHSYAYYEDTSHQRDILYLPAGELVHHFVVVGDTRGNEAGTRTGVQVHFNPITFRQGKA